MVRFFMIFSLKINTKKASNFTKRSLFLYVYIFELFTIQIINRVLQNLLSIGWIVNTM